MRPAGFVVVLLLVVVALAGTMLIARPGTPKVEPAPSTGAKDEKPKPAPVGDPPVSPTGPYPKAVIPEREFEFGSMAVHGKMSHKFIIENKGEAPLVLKKGETTCKCTLSNLEKDAIPVGEKAEVEMAWEPKDVNPEFNQSAIIRTNDPDQREIKFKIRGEVVSVLTMEPNGVWSLGDLPDDKPVTVSGALYSRTQDQFEIVSITGSDPSITAEHQPMTEAELKPRKARFGYTIRATVTPSDKSGELNGNLTIKTDVKTNGGDPTDFTVALKGSRSGPIRFLPLPGAVWHPEAKAFDFGEFAAKDGKKAKLLLFVTKMDEEFKVTDIESDTPFLKVDIQRDGEFKPGATQRFQMTFEAPPGSPPTTKVRSGAARIKVKTNHPNESEMVFRVEMIST